MSIFSAEAAVVDRSIWKEKVEKYKNINDLLTGNKSLLYNVRSLCAGKYYSRNIS